MTTLTDRALDLQLDLLHWHADTDYGQRYSGAVTTALIEREDWMSEKTYTETDRLARKFGRDLHRELLTLGATYAVSAEICDVLESAAPTVPDYELQPSDLPTDSGFVLLERPILIYDDVAERPLVVRAFGWVQAQRDVIEGEQGREQLSLVRLGTSQMSQFVDDDANIASSGYGIITLLWTDPSDPRDHMNNEGWATYFRDELDTLRARSPEDLMSMLGGNWVFGQPPHGHFTKLLLAFLRFVAEPWVDPRAMVPGRAARRRSLRKKLEPQVHVVRLRRREQQHHASSDSDSIEFEWSCRWIVQGHWRNQWYPSLQSHRPRWISEYVKGPEDKPLVVHDTIFQVDR
jgi:hypothetical protein